MTVKCANPDHRRDVPAIARLTYPDGRFDPTTACESDLGWLVRQALDDGGPVLVSPVDSDRTPPVETRSHPLGKGEEAATCPDCDGAGELLECRSGGRPCSHTNDVSYPCLTCKGEGEVQP